jgi:hypothetical protein
MSKNKKRKNKMKMRKDKNTRKKNKKSRIKKMRIDYTKCVFCQGRADLTVENGDGDGGEPQCMRCAIRATAMVYCDHREGSKEEAAPVLQGLKDRFPWEPVQELFDKQVLQLATDSEYQEMVIRNINNPIPDRPKEWKPAPPANEVPQTTLDELVKDGTLETKINSLGVRVYRLS